MNRICPKCNYARQPTDDAPAWQCPSCHVAYNKVGSTPPPASYTSTPAAAGAGSSGALKWLLLAAAIGAGIWLGKPLWQARHVAAQVAATQAANGQPAVTLYSTEWCGYCRLTREMFVAGGVRFTEFDIEKTTAGYEGHKKLGGNGVPLIVVGDDVIHGYDEARLQSLLRPWMQR